MLSRLFLRVCCFSLLVSPAVLSAKRLVIIHTNDRHGYIEAYKDKESGLSVGGADVEASLLKKIKLDALLSGARFLAVDAGDLFQGTPVVNATRGACMIEILNKFGFQMITFGNHEFDYGYQVLHKRMKESRFIWISSSVRAKALADEFIPFATYTFNGVKIAFLGVTTTTTPEKQMADRIKGIEFKEPVKALRPLVDRLKHRGVSVFILISHLGVTDDKRVAAALPVFSLIIGGHSHTLLSEPLVVGDTRIVQADHYAKYVGIVSMDISGDGVVSDISSEVRLVDRSIYEPDQGFAEIVKGYTDKLDKELEQVVGICEVPLEKWFGGVDSQMGVVCAQAFREACGTDIGIMNIGGTRNGLDRGPVTRKELLMVLPFGNSLVKLRMTGRQVKEMLSKALDGQWRSIPEDKKKLLKSRGWKDLDGLIPAEGAQGWLVGAGLKYVCDPCRPPGKRLVELELAGEPVQDGKIYTIATNDFLSAGGDGFDGFTSALSEENCGILDVDCLEAYFRRHKVLAAPLDASVVNLSFSGP